MPTKVVMEALSPTMEEGRLVEWKKQEGEPVAVGDVLAEVETDKAVMELVARTAGTMLKHTVEAGATVPVAETVAMIGQPGEDVSGAVGQQGGRTRAPKTGEAAGQRAREQGTQPTPGENRAVSMPPAPPAATATEERRPSERAPAREGNGAKSATPSPARSESARTKASPLARRMAAERGLDLASLTGSGPEGRVVARDLEGAAALSQPGAAARPPSPAPLPRRPSGTPYTDVPLSQIRKTIAKRLTQSIAPIPTF
jgi:pyruvate dehydrogenase E2 component (dihydrolipoamide acetyltransferase)